MNVLVDAVIYQLQKRGGISRMFSEILPRACQAEPALHVELVVTGALRQALPVHPQIHHRLLFRPERWLPSRPWRLRCRLESLTRPVKPVIQSAQLRPLRDYLWHSSYYSLPPTGWRGPRVFFVADMIHELYPHYFAPGEDDRERKAAAIRAADRLICISDATRNDLLSLFDIASDKTSVVHLAHSEIFRRLDMAKIPVSATLQGSFVLFVGERGRYKEFTTLLEAYRQWPQNSEVALVVVGAPWSPAEHKALVDARLADSVVLFEWADDNLLCALYNQAAAFVLPSLAEGFGIPLLEAMACGCPIVASRIAPTLEVAEDCPIYFEPGQAESLRAALEQALTEGRQSPRTEAGLARAAQFSWDATARQVVEVYRYL